jgi:tRNA(fMet)-specific endonuclease VapC
VTEPRYLLDTNICIHVLAGGPPLLRRRLESHEPGSVVTSSIAYSEVMRDLIGDVMKEVAAAKFFSVFEPLPFSRAEAHAYAGLPFRPASFGRLIAAHALSLNAVLVTNNERDFQDVPGLAVENWNQQ